MSHLEEQGPVKLEELMSDSPATHLARQRYEQLKAAPLALDLTRGKPCSEQLDLSLGLLTALGAGDYRSADKTDCRNYGGLDGLQEMRALFGALLDVPAERVLVEGASSLTLMHDTIVHAVLHGVPDGNGPWVPGQTRFLCPAPGYDRHFSICEHLGIEMVSVPVAPGGLDMDEVERLVATDARIKGMWIVPKYGNPTGLTLSPGVVARLARMKTAAPDFRVFWDNAYLVHDLVEPADLLANVYVAAEEAKTANRFLQYTSFSKVTFAGAGLAAMAASPANLDWMRKQLSFSTIGPDKLNQLRHARFFANAGDVRAHMQKHAAILRPKFELVERVLARELGGKALATWTQPRGGYFVSLDTQDGHAARVVKMAADVGVKLTPAGSSFPYRKDPRDRNIRIAPSFPSIAELERAIEVLAIAIACA